MRNIRNIGPILAGLLAASTAAAATQSSPPGSPAAALPPSGSMSAPSSLQLGSATSEGTTAAATTSTGTSFPVRETLPEEAPRKQAAGDEVQRLGFVETAYGSSARVVFAGVTGRASSSSEEQAQLGVLLGGSPLERLTLHGVVGRDGKGHFAPSLAVQYAFLGGGLERHALGALAQYKAEGFTEAGGELELGALFSLRPSRFRLDFAAIFGLGLEEEETEAVRPEGEEEGEADVEGKLRLGYQLFEPLRVGLVGRFRQRVVGERSLAGDKSWDFIGGGELVASLGPCVISASGGPTTVGVADGVGAYGLLSIALFSAL